MQLSELKHNPPGNNAAPRKFIIALPAIFFIYFLGKALYFALNIGTNISPDEISHFERSLIFSKAVFLPEDSPESYESGLIAHTPYLYYWLMGKLVHLNVLGVSDLLFLRCINILLGLGALWFSWKTISLLTEKTSTRLLFIVFCTNTLMLTFLYSFVSYDNLANLFAVASLYYLLSYFQRASFTHFLLFGLCVLAGCLTKLSFIPFAGLVLLVFLFRERGQLGRIATGLRSCFVLDDPKRSVLAALCFFLLFLNFELHLGNVVRFKSLKAPAETVLGLENAMQYRVFARSHVVRQFREDKLSLPEARNMAARYIKHEGDRNGAYYLLNIAAQEKRHGQKRRVDRVRYAFPWGDLMLGKTYGIMGHKSMEKTGVGLIPHMLIILFGAVLMIRRIRPSDMHGTALALLGIFVGYALVVMQLVNYKSYDSSGAIILALQGRYLFPVITAGYALLAFYLTSFRSRRWNTLIALATAGVFVAGEFPWFLAHVTGDWYLR